MSYYDYLRREQDKDQLKLDKQSRRIERALQGQLFQGEEYIKRNMQILHIGKEKANERYALTSH